MLWILRLTPVSNPAAVQSCILFFARYAGLLILQQDSTLLDVPTPILMVFMVRCLKLTVEVMRV